MVNKYIGLAPLNNKLAAGLSAGFSMLISFFVFTKSFLDEHHPNFYEQHIETAVSTYYIAIHFITGFLTLYLSYEFCFWVFRKKWKTRKKHILAFFGTAGVAMFVCVFLSIIMFQFLPKDFIGQIAGIALKRGFVSAVIVFLSTWAISTFVRNQQTLVENQRLIAENIRNRHEALKNQLNPHFLFNSLNTLGGLICLEDEKAHQYLQNLSSTFRYTIQNKEITTLKDEMNFVECYAYLMKIRYGDNLKIQYAVNENYNYHHILPVSLQTLIENAIKHNVINDKRPLTINIETTENNTIKVSNAIQPKINAEAGEGIGLANLAERYQLLFKMDVVITKTDIFTVEIPLIKEYESRNN